MRKKYHPLSVRELKSTWVKIAWEENGSGNFNGNGEQGGKKREEEEKQDRKHTRERKRETGKERNNSSFSVNLKVELSARAHVSRCSSTMWEHNVIQADDLGDGSFFCTEENRAETKGRKRSWWFAVLTRGKKEYSTCPSFIRRIHTGILVTSTLPLMKQITHVNSFNPAHHAIWNVSMHFLGFVLVFCTLAKKLNLI